jgi:hypothetical protein
MTGPAEVFPISKSEQTRRVWTCPKGDAECRRTKPCRSCLGRRNRRNGQRKQRAAAKALHVPSARFASQNAHEEGYLGTLRTENKSGAQVKGVWNAYLRCETQNELARPIGDVRPFAATFMPDGVSDGLLVCRLSKLREVAAALGEQL